MLASRYVVGVQSAKADFLMFQRQVSTCQPPADLPTSADPPTSSDPPTPTIPCRPTAHALIPDSATLPLTSPSLLLMY